MKCYLLLLIIICTGFNVNARIIPGAENMDQYLPLLQGRRVAVIINQTSKVGNSLLADTLLKRCIHVVTIFVPEHGFRGQADAGTHINNDRDSATGLPIISLYGSNKKPTKEQLRNVDILIYDLQDVGARFYTYISTLQYAMEACAAQGKHLLVLDRPDPNGHYVDGPVLDTALHSFVGMQPIPIVYGMTPGEYAKMLCGEHWIPHCEALKLTVISCKNYDHDSRYALPVAPSPNLRTMQSIYLYPSLCLFEGTVISLGRGTDKPFEQWGNPLLENKGLDSFRPMSIPGASKPPFEGKTCYGKAMDEVDVTDASKGFQLKWLLMAYNWYPDKEHFFNNFFKSLAGTNVLKQQIESGLSEKQIKASWEPQLASFKKMRKKYLLYKDFGG